MAKFCGPYETEELVKLGLGRGPGDAEWSVEYHSANCEEPDCNCGARSGWYLVYRNKDGHRWTGAPWWCNYRNNELEYC